MLGGGCWGSGQEQQPLVGGSAIPQLCEGGKGTYSVCSDDWNQIAGERECVHAGMMYMVFVCLGRGHMPHTDISPSPPKRHAP